MFAPDTTVVTFRKYDAKNGGRTAGVSLTSAEAKKAFENNWKSRCTFVQIRDVEDTVRYQWSAHRNTWVCKPGKNPAGVQYPRKLDTPEHAEYRETILAY